MGEQKIYSFLNDFVFKCVFGQQKNAKLLISLLNAITHRKGPETIDQVQILNPFSLQEFKTDKLSVVDVKAKSRGGSWFTIEVPKLDSPASTAPKTKFERWMHILKYGKRYCAGEKAPIWVRHEEEISMALDQLTKVNANNRYRQLLEQREKAERDHHTFMNSAFKKGLAEGLEQGVEKGAEAERKSLVRRMLSMGQSPETVAELTGISLEKVLQLAQTSQEYPSGEETPPKKVSEPRRRPSRKKP